MFSDGGPISEVINIKSGQITGVRMPGNRVTAYKGIPYAAPPIGELRWKPTQPIASWKGVRACHDFGPAAPQPKPFFGPLPEKMSEDCLYLNIWTPVNTLGGKMPVMVWIHGGGFNHGTGATPLYDGTKLAEKGVVVVTINYRIGVFGFLAHPLLSRESPHGVSGNYGILDQLMVLKWVKDNISAFGGDPGNVTVFGESAGAVSVQTLMISPASKRLFQRAISQSLADMGNLRHLRKKTKYQEPAESAGEKLSRELGCSGENDVLAAMRRKTTDEVMDTAKIARGLFGADGYHFWTVVDGWLIPDHPINMFQDGKQHDIPYLLGFNEKEYSVFMAGQGDLSLEMTHALARNTFQDSADEVIRRFIVEKKTNLKDKIEHVMTLYSFATPMKSVAAGMARKKSKTFVYRFSRVPPYARAIGAFHALEIPYVFGSMLPLIPTGQVPTYDEADISLSNSVMDYWVNFARHGDPNNTGLYAWPAYHREEEKYLDLGDTITAKQNLYHDDCNFLSEVAGKRRAH